MSLPTFRSLGRGGRWWGFDEVEVFVLGAYVADVGELGD